MLELVRGILFYSIVAVFVMLVCLYYFAVLFHLVLVFIVQPVVMCL